MIEKNLILCAIALALAACSAKEEAAKAPLIKSEGERIVLSEPDKADFLKLATVDRDQGGILRLPGRLVWNEEKTVRVFPQLGGRVQRIAVDVGQTVKAGQTLALLSSGDFGQAEADALRARAEADRARRRLAGLGGEGDGSYAVKTPLAGVVVERTINPGMEFRPDQATVPLFVVTDPRSLWLQIDAAEADLPYLKAGEKVDIQVKQFPGEKFQGVIRHVADFVDPQTRTIKVRCEVPNAERRLKGEMFVQIAVELPATDMLMVPAAAVLLQGNQRYVMVEAGKGEFVRRQVEAGSERDGRVEIRSGLQAGDKVVVEGNLHLAKYIKTTAAGGK